jgi:hypothetical protein
VVRSLIKLDNNKRNLKEKGGEGRRKIKSGNYRPAERSFDVI